MMLRRMLLAFAALLLTLSAQALDFTVDPVHSDVGFSVRHMMVSNVNGTFGEFSGAFTLDAEGKLAALTGTIQVTSIDTNNAKRDAHLRTPDFFDVPNNPTITFVLKSYEGDAKQGKATGTLTMRGVSKEITLDVELSGVVVDNSKTQRSGVALTGSINRFDYGVSFSKAMETGGLMVSDTVKLSIDLQGVVKK